MLVVALVIIIGTGLYFAAFALVFNEKCMMGEEIVSGIVEKDEWSADDMFNIDDYPGITARNGKIRILALTDTHLEVTGLYAHSFWYKNVMVRKAYKHIDTLVKTANPDFILVTGDILTDPLSDIVMEDFRNFMDSYNIPWTITFGNHDAEWRADKAALCNIIRESDNTLFRVGPTNLQGLGNSVINFKDEDGNIFYSLVTMDTGDWQKIDDYKIQFKGMHLDKTEREFSTVDVGYSDDQADWYRWVIEGLKACNDGATVETMVASHIPFKANNYAVALSSDSDYLYNPDHTDPDGSDYYETPGRFKNAINREELQAAYEDYAANYKFFNTVKELGSTKTFTSGHIHSHGYAVKHDGITYVSVVKTTDIYISHEWDRGKRGGTYFEISVLPEKGSHLTVNKPWYYKEVR